MAPTTPKQMGYQTAIFSDDRPAVNWYLPHEYSTPHRTYNPLHSPDYHISKSTWDFQLCQSKFSVANLACMQIVGDQIQRLHLSPLPHDISMAAFSSTNSPLPTHFPGRHLPRNHHQRLGCLPARHALLASNSRSWPQVPDGLCASPHHWHPQYHHQSRLGLVSLAHDLEVVATKNSVCHPCFRYVNRTE